MAMTPEKRVKKQVVEQLKSLGAEVYYFFPMTGGYGKSGVPDIVGCYRGMFFAIECKAGKNSTTMLQDREIAAIHAAEGAAWVVNESTADNVRAMMLARWTRWSGNEFDDAELLV
jgi:Holliday junction resolvase